MSQVYCYPSLINIRDLIESAPCRSHEEQAISPLHPAREVGSYIFPIFSTNDFLITIFSPFRRACCARGLICCARVSDPAQATDRRSQHSCTHQKFAAAFPLIDIDQHPYFIVSDHVAHMSDMDPKRVDRTCLDLVRASSCLIYLLLTTYYVLAV